MRNPEMEQSDKPILDYGQPPPPLRRRDSAEYYREPPNSSGLVIGIASVLLFLAVYAILVCAGIVRLPG